MRSKAKIKDSLLVTVKLSSREVVDMRECQLFEGRGIKGFLKITASKKNKLEYMGPVAITLKEWLKVPVCKRDFFLMMAQIVEATRKLCIHNLPFYKLNRDFNSIYINRMTKELYFMYMPIEMPYQKTEELDFISSVVYSVMPDEDGDFLPQFNYFIRNMQSYDSDKVEAYIASIDRKIIDMIGSRSREQSGFITNKPQEYIEHYNNKANQEPDYEKTGLLIDEEQTGLLTEESEAFEATGLLIDEPETPETGLLVENQNMSTGAAETGLLVEEQDVRRYFPTLHRVLTGQDVVVNKPVFRIGKEKAYVDFFVMNNDAISRSHADIITRGQRFYVKDLNSKNRSFINNRVLPVQYEVEIFDGDILKLANEEFVFHA